MIIDRLTEVFAKIKNKHFAFLDAILYDKPAFEHVYIEDNKSPCVIIYGDNASGKSLFTEIFHAVFRSKKNEKYPPIGVRNVGMRNRTASGFEKSFVFGDESDQSTGETSIAVTKKAFNSSLSEKSAVIILDEPDVGLSDRFQAAFGQYIAERALTFTDHALILVSHNKTLINSFLRHYGKPVSFIGVCTELKYEDWQNSIMPATVEELINLSTYANDKWRAIAKAWEI